MKNLKLINLFLVASEVLAILGLTFVIIFFIAYPEDRFMNIGDPYWKVSKELSEKMIFHLPPGSEENPSYFDIVGVDLKIQANKGVKLVLIATAVLFGAYFTWLFELMRRIVRDVQKVKSFTTQNIRRVKVIGMMVCAIPILTWGLKAAFKVWLKSTYTFEGLRLAQTSDSDSFLFIVGLLFFVLGVALQQAQKIQDENELTI